MKSGNNIGVISLGRVYRCPVCGAELSVIRSGRGGLRPVCCNTEMVQLKKTNHVYVCPICGSELMIIKGGENLQPICCNEKMRRAEPILADDR